MLPVSMVVVFASIMSVGLVLVMLVIREATRRRRRELILALFAMFADTKGTPWPATAKTKKRDEGSEPSKT